MFDAGYIIFVFNHLDCHWTLMVSGSKYYYALTLNTLLNLHLSVGGHEGQVHALLRFLCTHFLSILSNSQVRLMFICLRICTCLQELYTGIIWRRGLKEKAAWLILVSGLVPYEGWGHVRTYEILHAGWNYVLIIIQDIPQQFNSSDCGVFLLQVYTLLKIATL